MPIMVRQIYQLMLRATVRTMIGDMAVVIAAALLLSFMVGFYADKRIDAFAFQLRADYTERLRVPMQADSIPEKEGQLRVIEALGGRLVGVNNGLITAPSIDDITPNNVPITIMIVPDDLSVLSRYFGGNVPDHIRGSGVMVDQSSAAELDRGVGDRIAIWWPNHGDTTESAMRTFAITALVKPYSEPTAVESGRGIVYISRSLISDVDLATFIGGKPHDAWSSLYKSVFAPPGESLGVQGSESRHSLAWQAISASNQGFRTLIGGSVIGGVGIFMWILIGLRADRRLRSHTSSTRAVTFALGARPRTLDWALALLVISRTLVAAIMAGSVSVYFLLPYATGRVGQAPLVAFLCCYLFVMTLPQLAWLLLSARRERRKSIEWLFLAEE